VRLNPDEGLGHMGQFKRFGVLLVVLCALPMVATAQVTSVDPHSPPPLGKLVDVGGYRVHLYCTGAGSPTIVIVGAGFSFDWGLVQPEVAKFTQVCSYDPSGSAWSDDGPTGSCTLRVREIHDALKNAGIKGPYVLVGHSFGGLVARLYAGQYPNDVAGVVFVDHAFAMINRRPPPGGGAAAPPAMPHPLPGTAKIVIGMEDDANFSKLSAGDRELHHWATTQARGKAVSTGDPLDLLFDCVAQADAIIKDQSHPLGDKPLVDVTAGIFPPLPPPAAEQSRAKYEELQTKLLSLSGNSKRLVAENSGHFITIDRPDVVIDAISQVVQSVRDNNKL
jgi:pimeloyl-ACP methyl ester carboxylesterase